MIRIVSCITLSLPVALYCAVPSKFPSNNLTSTVPQGTFAGTVNDASRLPSTSGLTEPEVVPLVVVFNGVRATWRPSNKHRTLFAEFGKVLEVMFGVVHMIILPHPSQEVR